LSAVTSSSSLSSSCSSGEGERDGEGEGVRGMICSCFNASVVPSVVRLVIPRREEGRRTFGAVHEAENSQGVVLAVLFLCAPNFASCHLFCISQSAFLGSVLGLGEKG